MDLVFILHFFQRHLPGVTIIKGYHTHFIFRIQLIHSRFGSRDRQIQIGASFGLFRHTARMINHHDHCQILFLIHPTQLHIDRKKFLQFRILISAQCKTVLAAACHQTASVVFHISFQIF